MSIPASEVQLAVDDAGSIDEGRRGVSASEKYAELEAAGVERPRCECHDQPMRWRKDASCWRCAVSAQESSARHRATNLDAIRARGREYARRQYQQNPQREREKSQRWRDENREKARLAAKEYDASHREERRLAARERYHASTWFERNRKQLRNRRRAALRRMASRNAALTNQSTEGRDSCG